MAGNITSGMDIAQVRTLANELNQAGTTINDLATKLTNVLQNTPWEGNDKQRFVNDWNGTHKPNLTKIVSALADAARSATTNANEQEQAAR